MACILLYLMNLLDQAKMSDREKLSPDPDSTSIPLMSSTDNRESEPHDDDHQNPPKKSSAERRLNLKVVLEAVVLTFFLVFLWAVYAAVPTVFYVLKPILQVHDGMHCCTVLIILLNTVFAGTQLHC